MEPTGHWRLRCPWRHTTLDFLASAPLDSSSGYFFFCLPVWCFFPGVFHHGTPGPRPPAMVLGAPRKAAGAQAEVGVRSAGFSDGNEATFVANGREVFRAPQRGLTLVTLRPDATSALARTDSDWLPPFGELRGKCLPQN